MSQKNRTRVAVLIAVIVVAAVFGSFAFTFFSTKTPHIVLPSLLPDSSQSNVSGTPDEHVQRVDVTVSTVQAVIASLDRTGSYYRQLSVQTFWEGGSGTFSAQTWADDGFTYVRSTMPSGQMRYSLSTPDGTVYYWYGGSSVWRIAPADSLSADLSQRIPTYEDVLALDSEQISDAGYDAYGEHPCIYVETLRDEFGYVERYWVSTDSGLLVAAQTLKEDTVVYSVNATAPIQTPCPTDSVFTLPDGTALHSF